MTVELSILLPIFNEEPILEKTLAEVRQAATAVSSSFEIICVDDGSRDGSARLLQKAQATDPRIVVVELSRNFGKEAAMAAGLDHAKGRAVLLLDADLQHPPQLMAEMVAAWRRGAEVVNGVKASRGEEGRLYGMMAKLFNRLMSDSTRSDSFRGASDFKLLDRQVVEALRACPERHRFFRGLVAWVGFRTQEVSFHVQERTAGETKWSTRALLRYSLRNLLSFSALPLRLIAIGGFSTLVFACLMGLWTLIRYFRGDSLEGFPTVILLQLIFGGILLTSLGVMSLYLAEMFEELKRRPIYLYRQPTPPLAHTSAFEEAKTGRTNTLDEVEAPLGPAPEAPETEALENALPAISSPTNPLPPFASVPQPAPSTAPPPPVAKKTSTPPPPPVAKVPSTPPPRVRGGETSTVTPGGTSGPTRTPQPGALPPMPRPPRK